MTTAWKSKRVHKIGRDELDGSGVDCKLGRDGGDGLDGQAVE